MDFTIIGANGFIGGELCNFLEKKNIIVNKVARDDILSKEGSLGIVVYCAGNGDCKNTPSKVIDSNINLLKDIIDNYNYERLIYISSTRVYLGLQSSNESSDLSVINSDSRKLFNLSKLCAEELCLNSSKDNIVFRVSNVYGRAVKSPLFLPSIIRDSIHKGVVDMYITPNYSKDYIFVGDLLEAIYTVSMKDTLTSNVYNVASGRNTKASDIADVINYKNGAKIKWHNVSYEDVFPITDISRISKEIEWKPRDVLEDIGHMIDSFTGNLADEYID